MYDYKVALSLVLCWLLMPPGRTPNGLTRQKFPSNHI